MIDVLAKQYGAAAKLPEDVRQFKALKHSCGTHLMERGEGVELVQDHWAT